MEEQETFVGRVRTYLERPFVIDRRTPGRRIKPTQKLLLEMDPATLSKKMNGELPLTNRDVWGIGFTLVNWGCFTHRRELQHFLGLGNYQLSENDWLEKPWKFLIDDTQPSNVVALPIQNASFEDWTEDKLPSKWCCVTKTGRIKPVPGRETKGSAALEISGNPGNQEWVYCRTRETQTIAVVPSSRVSFSFWARKTQEGQNPQRAKYIELFYYDGYAWAWLFGQEVTDKEWLHYETEWWDLPASAQKVAVGVVVFKDGAFQVDDIELRMLERK